LDINVAEAWTEGALWNGRPDPGPALRPQDLPLLAFELLWTSVGAFLSYRESGLVFGLFLLLSAYLLFGRFFHDAALRWRLRYALSADGLAVWKEGRPAPECVIDLLRLRDVVPKFVTPGGRGTIELPPGGWAAQPAWINRWDRSVPAVYPCRRLELIDDVEAVAALMRAQARLKQDGPAGGEWIRLGWSGISAILQASILRYLS
jgi:hypothetical protein